MKPPVHIQDQIEVSAILNAHTSIQSSWNHALRLTIQTTRQVADKIKRVGLLQLFWLQTGQNI